MANEDIFPVVVIGSGIAGLTAALHLGGRGIPAVVLEADSLWMGGRLSGGDDNIFEYDGRIWSFHTEHGMHALWGNYDNMRATFDRFLDIDLQISPGEEWINRWGKEVRYIEAGNAIRSRWIPAPFHYLQLLFNPLIWANITPLDFLSLPGLLNSILFTVGFDPIKEQRPLDGLKMKDYFLGWTPNLRATFTGLGVNLLAAPKEEIGFAEFIAAIRFYTMLRRDAWNMQYFCADANTALIQPMIDKIEEQDGFIFAGAEAQSLQHVDEGWRISVFDSRSGGMRSMIAEHVILAIDPQAAKRLLCNHPDTAESADKMFFMDAVNSIAVRLWFDESPREGTPGGMMTGDFMPDNFFWMHRLYDEFKEWHDVTGGSVIELHFYPNKELVTKPDSYFLVTGVNEVQRAFPNLKGHFVHGAVRRNSRTQPVFRIPTEADSLYVQTPWENIHACGDWIGYDTPSYWMERSCVTAVAAANRVIEASQLEPYPILQPKPPEMTVRVLAGFVRILRFLLAPIIMPIFRLFRRGKA